MSAHSEGGNNAGWKKAINHDASRSREIVCTCSPVLRAVGRHLCLQVATLWHPEAAWRVSLGTGVGGQDPLSIAPELPSPVPSGDRPCARMAFGRVIKRRKDVRMSHEMRHEDRKSTRLN